MNGESLPFIRYNMTSDEYRNNVGNQKFNKLSKQIDINDFCSSFIADFTAFSTETLIKNPTNTIKIADSFIKRYFSELCFEEMAEKWPPVAIAPCNGAFEVFYLFTRLIHDSVDRIPVIRLLISTLRPFKDNEDDSFVVFNGIDENKKQCYGIFRLKNKLEFISETETTNYIVSSFNLSKEEKEISFVFDNGNSNTIKLKNIEEFSNLENLLTKIEENRVFNGEICFTDIGNGPYPEKILDQFRYFFCSFRKQHLLHSFLLNCNFNDLIKPLFDVFTYEKRINLLYGSILIIDLENCESAIDLSNSNSLTVQMVKFLVNSYIERYKDVFLKKILEYIDDGCPYAFTSSKEDLTHTKLAFFSSIKYLTHSAFAFPNEISHFLSFVRMYSSLKFNIRNDIFNLITDIFFSCIFFPAVEGKGIFKDLVVKNKEQVMEIAKYIKVVCQHNILTGVNPRLSEWEDRIKYKVHPKVDFFFAKISECLEKNIPEYQTTTKEIANKSAEKCLESINKSGNKIRETLSVQFKHNLKFGGTYSWNFALLVSLMFPNAGDKKELKMNKENLSEDYRNQVESTPYTINEVSASPFVATNKVENFVHNLSFSKLIIPNFNVDDIRVPQNNIIPQFPPIPFLGDDSPAPKVSKARPKVSRVKSKKSNASANKETKEIKKSDASSNKETKESKKSDAAPEKQVKETKKKKFKKLRKKTSFTREETLQTENSEEPKNQPLIPKKKLKKNTKRRMTQDIVPSKKLLEDIVPKKKLVKKKGISRKRSVTLDMEPIKPVVEKKSKSTKKRPKRSASARLIRTSTKDSL